MKINKSNPLHWLYLAIFSINIILTFIARKLTCEKHQPPLAILYGHKLSGSLKTLLDEAAKNYSSENSPQLHYLTMDPGYYWQLRANYQTSVLLGLNPFHISKLIKANAIISDHGLHSLKWLLGTTSIKFVDVWHGIPFKGFTPEDFTTQHAYDEVWVASGFLRTLYTDKFGFAPEIVQVTGYARTDKLVHAKENLRPNTSDPESQTAASPKKTILFAPTWRQDDTSRSNYPFGISEEEFLSFLNKVCLTFNATCVVRSHLNSREKPSVSLDEIVFRSADEFPVTEDELLKADVLICDWSSIAFDYLLLDRPAIFLDVPAPFKNGFSLGPEFRYGEIASDINQLELSLKTCLDDPEAYWRLHRAKHVEVKETVYGEMADGKATERCLARLKQLIETPTSSG